jgi:hypothetical protein
MTGADTLRLFFPITFLAYNVLRGNNTVLQGYNSTFRHKHTLYKFDGDVSLRRAANTAGGEFRSRLLQVFAAIRSPTERSILI